MEALGIDPIQLGAQIINFVVLVFLLKRFLYTPILSMLDKRKKEIEEGLSLKGQMEEEKIKLDEDHKKLRRELREEERRVMKQAVIEAKKREKEILEEAKKEIQAEREKMMGEVESEREKIVEQAKQQALTYAVRISEKLLGQKIDIQSQERLLQEALSGLRKE